MPHRASNIDLIAQQISWLMDGVVEHIAMEMNTQSKAPELLKQGIIRGQALTDLVDITM